MKLHLPKNLLVAVLAAGMGLSQAAITINTETNVASEGSVWSKTFSTDSATYVQGNLGNNRLDVVKMEDADALKSSIVIADGKHLFLQTYGGDGNLKVDGSIYVGHSGGIRVGMDNYDVSINNIYLTNDASIYEYAGNTSHTVTIAGTVTDKVPTDTDGQTYDSQSTFTINGGKYVFTGAVEVNKLAITNRNSKTTQVTFEADSTLNVTNISNEGTVSFKNLNNISEILNKVDGTGTVAIDVDTQLDGAANGCTVYDYEGKIQVNSGATLTIGAAKSDPYNNLWAVDLTKAELNLQGGTATIYGGASKFGTISTSNKTSTLELHATKQNGKPSPEEVSVGTMNVNSELNISGQWESKLRIETLTLNNTLKLDAHTGGSGKDATVTIGKMSGTGMLQLVKGNYVLEEGEHSIDRLDTSQGGNCIGTLKLEEKAHLTVGSRMWLSNKADAKIILESGASLKRDALKVIGRGSTSTITRDTNVATNAGEKIGDEYSLDNVVYTISNADAEVTAATGGTTISNILKNVSLINTGSGLLTAGNGNSYYSGLAARNGNIEINGFANQAAQTSVSLLEIAANKTLSVNKNWNASKTAATVEVDGKAIFAAGSRLQAHLTLKEGTSVQMDGTLTMGSDTDTTTAYTLSLEKSLSLSGTLVSQIATMTAGKETVLITGVDTLKLGDQTYNVSESVLDVSSGVKLSDYFSSDINLDNYYLGFNTNGDVYAGLIIPEPATATLSLLALAGLCARRRRSH
ncbi:MAG: hypothetical protein IKJ29_09910 [Akkermansia sp.]|nr:hypothetical protein [Akkermansia sp.]